MGVDIAIDLTGLTQYGRPGIFAYRAAPIQLSYVGYLGTMGASYYDYLIADRAIINKNDLDNFCEKIIFLPSYQVNDSKRLISPTIFTKKEFGIPDENFVFCCFKEFGRRFLGGGYGMRCC